MALLEGLRLSGQWGLIGVVIVTNGMAGFALVRMFGLIFAGSIKPMTTRANEPLWLIVLPMAAMAGLTLHTPLIIRNLSLFPVDASMSWALGWTLFLSSVGGVGAASWFYILQRLRSPEKLLPPLLNRLLAYDFYTPKVYQFTAIALVDQLSRFADWLDRYIVDGAVNLVGFTSLLSGEALKYANNGKMQVYALTITAFVVAISLYLSWSYFV